MKSLMREPRSKCGSAIPPFAGAPGDADRSRRTPRRTATRRQLEDGRTRCSASWRLNLKPPDITAACIMVRATTLKRTVSPAVITTTTTTTNHPPPPPTTPPPPPTTTTTIIIIIIIIKQVF